MISCKIFIWLANYMRQRLDKCRVRERKAAHRSGKGDAGHAACLRNEVSKPLLDVARTDNAHTPRATRGEEKSREKKERKAGKKIE